MPAFLLLARSGLRGRWRALLALALLTTASCGFVLTAVNGARRAQTAWARFGTETDYPDAILDVPVAQVDAARRLIDADPDVLAAGAFSWLPASPEGFDSGIGLFAGLGGGFGDDVITPLIEEGRRANPSRADEVTVNAPYAALVGVEIGSTVHLVGPNGLAQDATVVGIHRSPLDLGPNGDAPNALGTPAFAAAWLPRMESIPGFDQMRPAIAIRFRDGVVQHAALQALAKQIPEAGVIPRDELDAEVRDGISASTTAYAVLTAAAAIATVLLLGFLLTAYVGSSHGDQRLLAALGTTRGLRSLVVATPTAVAVLAGLLCAPAVAIVASPLVRTGLAAKADPAKGRWFDTSYLLLATLVLALGIIVVLGVVARRLTSLRRGPTTGVMRPSRVVRLTAASPPLGLAACASLGQLRPSSRRLSRSILLTVGIAIFGAVAALTWRASATELTRDYRLQGWSFDVEGTTGPEDAPADVEAAAARLEAAHDTVAGLTAFWQTAVPFGGDPIDVFALTPRRGNVDLALVSGRAPQAPGEVVVGPVVLRKAGVRVGDDLELPGAHPVKVHVVGEVVFPLFGNTGFGTGILTDPATAASLGAEPQNYGYLIDLASGATAQDAQRVAGNSIHIATPSSSPDVERLLDAVGADTALAAFFAGLGIAVFGLGMVVATRRERLDYAVVRALGFRRRQVVQCFLWQSVITLAAAGIAAIPLGMALGRAVWRHNASSMGVLEDGRIVLGGLGPWAVGAVVTFTAVAGAVAIVTARATVARGLRPE